MDEYLDAKMQKEEINRNNAELVLRPEYFVIDYEMLHAWYLWYECALYWFIKFFLTNNEKFYCTNEQLSGMLGVSERSISQAISKLEKKWFIICNYIIRSWWWKIRFIKLQKTACQTRKNCVSETKIPQDIYNNIIDNKINNKEDNISIAPKVQNKGSILNKDPSDLSTLGPVPSEAQDFLRDSYEKYPSIKYQIDKQGEKYFIDTMKDRDKLCKEYGEETVKTVLNYIKQDDFWCKQIQSIGKLRKKNKDWVPYIVVIMDKITQYKPKIIDPNLL